MGEEAATEQGRPLLHFYEARSLARLARSRHIRSRLSLYCYLNSPPQLMGFSNECRDCVVCPLTVDDKIAGFPDTGPRRSFVPILLVYLNIKFLILGIKPILDTRTMMMHGRHG